ncbi:MAG TPA: hypothetical protein PKY06_22425 [Saprospiraceae bacterium]|nr:hypothetical protein [Saprospiraceae bacterium]
MVEEIQPMDCGEMLIRTYTAEMPCGDDMIMEQRITVIDDLSPKITELKDKFLSCNDEITWDKPYASDNCSSVSLIEGPVEEEASSCGYILTKTWYAVDECGNQSNVVSQTITVDNTSSITLTPPQDIYLSCTDVNELPGSSEPSVCEETTVYYTEGGHSITFEGYEYDKENNQTCYSYTIHSNIDPEISHSMIGDLDMMDCATCIGGEARISKADPTTQAYGCKWDEGIKKGKSKTYVICVEGSPELGKISTSIKYGRRVSTIQICGPASCESVNPPIEDKPLFGKPEVSVDCPVDYEIIEGEVIRQDLDCGYVLTKSWYAVSDCGGQTEPVTQHIYYIDETAPVINPVTDKTVSCNENWQWDKPEISDDCSSVSLIEGKIETKQLECGYQITKTWTAKDDCGNESGPVTQTITVIDETAPTFIDIPEDLTLSCIEDIPSPTVHAVDDCSEVKVTMKEETSSSQNQGCTIVNMDRPQEQAPRIGWFQNMPGANSNLFNVESGNFEQYGDGTAHFYGVVSNINNSNLAWEFDIWMRGGYNWDDWHALGRGYKDAGIAGNNYLDWTYYEMDDSKSNTLTGLRAYDGSELNLTHNPSNYYYGFQVGQNANVFTNTYGMSGWFNYSGTIVYNNHEYQRNSINSDFNLNLGCTENSTGCTTTILRTWTATDACGNTTSMSQSITISDHTKPSISPLEDKFYSCDEDWTWDMPVAQDECGTPDMIEGVETRTNTECGYQVSKSWYAIDACGNQSEIVTQTITVEDNEPPVFITTPQDIHLSCGQTMPDFTPLAAVDNCDGNVTVVYKDSTVNQGSHCDVVNMDWSNESDPRIGWFQNMPGASSLLFHVEQGGLDQFADGTAHFYGTVSNVNNDQLAWEFDIWMRNGSNWEEWSAMGRGYKNSGIAGNNYLDWTYYEMDDSKANTFTGIRAYAGSQLSLTHNPSNYYYGFQVGENANVFTYTYGMSGWFTYYGDIVYNGNTYHRNGVNSDFNLNLGCTNSNNSCGTTVIRTTIATDHCGNQATVTQTITRDPDNTPPTISALQDKSYSCNEDWSWDAPVAEDNCGTPQLIEGLEVRSEIDCGYMMSKSWYAIDACGNQSEIVTQNITVLDDEAPIFIGNTGDIILSCGQPIPDFTPLTVVDNCDGNVTVTYQDSMVTEGGSHCDLVNMDWSNESDPRIGWFQNMPGASSLLFHVEQGGLDQFADGTAHFYGTVSNVNNDQLAWEFDIWMRNGSNWEEWSAMGRGYKNSGIAGNNYLDWTYYEMDDSKANTFTGIRAYAGSQLSLTHNPSNYYYGFQVGENANVFTYTYGMSGWFTYYGDIVYNGNTYHRNGVNSDFNLNLGCTEQSSSCGVTIYRTTTATDKCGNQASVTQKISVPADHEPPVVVNPPNVECITPITFESFFNNNWSLTATDNCSPDITVDIPEINWDCEAGKYILTYVFTDNCGNQTTFTRDVCIEGSSPVCSIIAPNEISTQASNTFMADVTGGMDPMQYEWTILSGNWNITSGGNSSTVNLDAGSDHLILELTVTDQNGCSSTCTVEADAPTSDLGGGCTLTQGFYGNDRGRYCDGRQTTPLITDLMASGPIVLGKPGRSFTLNSNDVACIIGLLGGGGPSVALNSGNGSCGSFNFSTRTSKGVATSKNTLVSQAITLALNMRLDGNLGSTQIMGNCMTTASSSNCGANGNAYPVPGTEQTFCFSTAVLQILGTGFTISELFDLASRALGGENVGVGLGDITDALGFINDGFDECRIVTSWSVTNSITEPDGDDLNTTSVEINTTVGKITAYPNPTVNLVKLAFEIPVATEEGNIQIVNGQGIPVYKETTPMQKGAKELQINTEGWTPGPYYVIVRVNAYIMYGQFIRVE